MTARAQRIARVVGAAVVVWVASAAAMPAAAQAEERPPPRELRHDLVLDLTVTGFAAGYWVTTELLKGALAPQRCRWCAPPGVDAAVRDALRWDATGAADALSWVTALGLAPVALSTLDVLAAHRAGDTGAAWPDLLVIAEAAALAMAVNQTLKFLVGRERPFVHALPDAEKAATAQPSDNNLSFFSGHTTFPFALAVAAGTVAQLRGYDLAPVIWATGLGVATMTGYLRIAADKHYLTDVLAGAAVGAVVGFVVPWAFHRPRAQSGRGGEPLTGFAAPLTGGGIVSVGGAF
jgi:membrane-associated phospholipid phosphatase